jgi:acetyltransferase-like isoleucine patch superfamily enzyme
MRLGQPFGSLLRERSLLDLLRAVWLLLSARLWLRKFTHVGRRVRTYGRPRVMNFGGSMSIGDRSTVFSNTVRSEFVVHSGGRIEIGSGVFLNYGASVSAHELVRLGDGCQIGAYANFMDNDYHRVGDLWAPSESGPIILGRNVWLGERVVVLKGVSIGDNSVIGAGSVVTKSVPANCLAAGVPAKVIRHFDPPVDAAVHAGEPT